DGLPPEFRRPKAMVVAANAHSCRDVLLCILSLQLAICSSVLRVYCSCPVCHKPHSSRPSYAGLRFLDARARLRVYQRECRYRRILSYFPVLAMQLVDFQFTRVRPSALDEHERDESVRERLRDGDTTYPVPSRARGSNRGDWRGG